MSDFEVLKGIFIKKFTCDVIVRSLTNESTIVVDCGGSVTEYRFDSDGLLLQIMDHRSDYLESK